MPLFISALTVGGPYNGRVRAGLAQPAPNLHVPARRPGRRRAVRHHILSALARRAYRRAPDSGRRADAGRVLQAARAGGGDFDAGVRAAIERLLVSPDFLFRIEADPGGIGRGVSYRLTDVELASRLSFFLWSSIPDDELLDAGSRRTAAAAGRSGAPGAADAGDPRARDALVHNFFGQWLQTRNVWLLTPDTNTKFPWFDDNLRAAIVRETELFLDDQLSADRSVVDLLAADSTFLNEQLARHYGIRGVYGSHFRRVALADENRWGLLGKASVLAVTSYPNAHVADHPGQVAAREHPGRAGAAAATRRQHEPGGRPADTPAPCAGCSSGTARTPRAPAAMRRWIRWGSAWRISTPSASGAPPTMASPWMPSGVLLDGTEGGRPGRAAARAGGAEGAVRRTVTGKLLTYAVGREMEHYDAPAVRGHRSHGRGDDYRWSSLDAGDREQPAVSDEEVAAMIVTKKALSRRTVLRGMGTAVALPLLDAMVPALTAVQRTAAAPVRRLGVVYHPNGVIYDKWLPKGTGRDFQLSPVLEPLAPFREQAARRDQPGQPSGRGARRRRRRPLARRRAPISPAST